MKQKYIYLLLFITIISNYTNAKSIGESTGYKLPRFVSTKFDETNLRRGPLKKFPIELTYTLKNFPIEIIEEHDRWRRIIDIDGNQGWILGNLLKGDRYGIIKTSHDAPAQIFNKPEGSIIGKIDDRNIVRLKRCFNSWCYINFNKYKGWINKINLWGVYKDEEFNIPFYQLLINLYWKIK